jgi:hypothetical protein
LAIARLLGWKEPKLDESRSQDKDAVGGTDTPLESGQERGDSQKVGKLRKVSESYAKPLLPLIASAIGVP